MHSSIGRSAIIIDYSYFVAGAFHAAFQPISDAAKQSYALGSFFPYPSAAKTV
jgi:hypothetical protein